MNEGSVALLLRVYLGESDMHDGARTHRHLMQMLREEGIAGVTVLRGVEGYGRAGRLRTERIERLSLDLPLVVEIVDTEERIARIRPLVAAAAAGALVTEEKVRVVSYGGSGKG